MWRFFAQIGEQPFFDPLDLDLLTNVPGTAQRLQQARLDNLDYSPYYSYLGPGTLCPLLPRELCSAPVRHGENFPAGSYCFSKALYQHKGLLSPLTSTVTG